jgi:hypothetical protein
MRTRQSAEFDPGERNLALLLGELDHRIRNLLMMIEAAVRQTHSTSVEDYRATEPMLPMCSPRPHLGEHRGKNYSHGQLLSRK